VSVITNSPFKDAIISGSVSDKGSKGGVYGGEPNLPDGLPGRDVSPNGVPELFRDTALTGSSPSTSGPLKSPFKDAI
jgi:hypothetical protein